MRVLLNVPKTAKKGEAIEIKILISHPMESGQRRDEMGQVVPRMVIHDFVCTYNGAEVIRLALFPAIALSRDHGIDHEAYPALRRWMRSVRALPGFRTMPGIPDYH